MFDRKDLFESECMLGSSTMAGSSDSALKLDRRLAFHGESISLLKAKTAIRRLCSLIGN